MENNLVYKYFFILLAILPISFIVGSSIFLVNVLIFDISFLILIFHNKNFIFFKHPIIKILFFLYFYLIFNTFISLEPSLSFFRNFGFIRLIILFIGINYFLRLNNFNNIFNIWSIIILIVCFDIFFERINGFNLLGFNSNKERIVSFFKDEAIPGSFVYSFSMILIGFWLQKFFKFSSFYRIFILVCILGVFISVILTGERSSSIKMIIFLIFFIFLFDFTSFKKKFLILALMFFLILMSIMKFEYVKNRMFDSIKYSTSNYLSSFIHGKPKDNPSGNLYAKLHRSGFDIFKKYPFFGVGTKNYRIEACLNGYYERGIDIMINDYVCETHPHQIYFELLAEHGAFGTFLIIFIFFRIFSKNFFVLKNSRNYISLGALLFAMSNFLPLIPSGSFFSDKNLTMFFINFSIIYASTKSLNIFNNNDKF